MFFFFTIRRPSKSTHTDSRFPHTTLFQSATLDSVTCDTPGIAALIGELRRVLVKEGTSSPALLDDFANVADDAQSYHHASISYIRGHGIWKLAIACRMQRS